MHIKMIGDELLHAGAVATNMVRGRRGTCTCCGFEGRFGAYGHPPRYGARCGRCGCVERHRLLALVVQDGRVQIGGDVLHVAPEPAVAPMVRSRAGRYVSADLSGDAVDINIDLCDTGLPDAGFDTVIACHVLEHVADDDAAIRECGRILRPRGVLVLMIPESPSARTHEDRRVTTARAREEHFGQRDHVRWYGQDVAMRLGCDLFDAPEALEATPEQVVRHRLIRGERVWVFRRRSGVI